MLGRKANIHKRRARAIAGLADPDNPPMPSGDALDTFRRRWPGNDPYEVIGRFQDKWRDAGCAVIRSPDGAFLKFAEGMFKARAVRAGWPPDGLLCLVPKRLGELPADVVNPESGIT